VSSLPTLVRTQVAALTVLFLAAHLLLPPRTLEDIDSVNFALGVRDFDVARHQPHPPGYPVFVALGKASSAILHALGSADPVPRALSTLSALSGASLVPLLFALYRRFTADVHVAWWAMAAGICAPLFWFTAVRPLSDMTGLAAAVASQVLLLSAICARDGAAAREDGGFVGVRHSAERPIAVRWPRAWSLIAGALLCGLAAGVRAQTVMLTAPLLAAALVWPDRGLAIGARLTAVGAALAGALTWWIPLLIASGGLSDYLSALGSQAGEDFSGVVMLWTARSPRVAVDALRNSFLWPWGSVPLGLIVTAAAALGLARVARRKPRTILLLALAFGPYAAFHLLFHETVTVRYALPLVVPVAFLAAYAAAALGRIGLTAAAGLLIAVMLAMTVPAVRAYSRDGSPAFRAFEEATRGPGGGTLAMHAGTRRVHDWLGGPVGWTVLSAPHGLEWLTLVEHWRRAPGSAARFLADPRRTDLALFDRRERKLDLQARWTFSEVPFVAGTRPAAIDLYSMQPPGWMLDRGWALTAEIGGVAARQGLGPQVAPSIAWVRARPGATSLLLGGRNLERAGGPSARVTLSLPSGPVSASDVPPGSFLRHLELPAGALAGSGYVPLRVTASPAAGSSRVASVSLEQFDLQSAGIPMFGFEEGWGEPEYNPSTGRAWRWMSERAALWVRQVGRDVTLILDGESPLRYFDRPPVVRITAAGQEIARFSPSADFDHRVTVPATLLVNAGGRLLLESDLWFTPSAAGGADARHLALRIFRVAVD
jgi:hypothetical protein